MFCKRQTQWLLSLALGLGTVAGAVAGADDKGGGKRDRERVRIMTVDSVELQGTFYPAAGSRRDACVLLLHDVHPGSGGTSHEEPWEEFAAGLQQAGYDVLGFDFRGFGDSIRVGPAFWDRSRFAYNQLIRGAARKPETIHFKDFPPRYLPHLANDVAAARAFLDRRNDEGELNSSNLILVGAGEGAALGLLWMTAECRLQRDAASDELFQVRHVLREPEGRDLACGVWVNLGSVLGGRRLPVQQMIKEVTQKGKVRSVFLYNERAGSAGRCARLYEEEANRGQKKKMACARAVEGWSRRCARTLLEKSTGVPRWLVENCLENVLEVRGVHDRQTQDRENHAFFWAFPWPSQPGARLLLAKRRGERLVHPLPIDLLLGR